MDKFTTLEGVAAPMRIINVDTDRIIPKQYLKTIKRTGLGTGLFAEMRYNDDGSENPDFVLNKPAYRDAKILVAGDNFGCGSSREHAPWALPDFGIRCVISTSFADIFFNNCFKNGILAIVVSPEDLEKLFEDAERGANATLSVDLEAQTIKGPDGGTLHFDIDPGRKHSLLNGLDEIGLTLQRAPRSTPTRRSSPRAAGPEGARPVRALGLSDPGRRLEARGPIRPALTTPPRIRTIPGRAPMPSQRAGRRPTLWLGPAAAGLVAGAARAVFHSCLSGIQAQAASQGSRLRPSGRPPSASLRRQGIELFQAQPEFKTPIWDYLAALVDDERVDDGKAAMRQHAQASAAEARYGVDRYTIAAVWGVESNFGKDLGKMPLVQSLATLACSATGGAILPGRTDRDAEDHRARRHRLDAPLRLLGRRLRTDPVHADDLPAARGRPRRRRAPRLVDSVPDAVGSTANFLRAANGPTASPGATRCSVPARFNAAAAGRKNKQRARALGLARA